MAVHRIGCLDSDLTPPDCSGNSAQRRSKFGPSPSPFLAAQTIGVFWEIYNATNRVNFDNPIGNRRSTDFFRSIVADEPRSMQIGLRYIF